VAFELNPEFYSQNLMLRRLPQAERSTVQARLKRVTFPKDEVLHPFGAPADYVYFPESGAVITTVNSAGREVDVLVTGREGMIGSSLLLASQPFHQSSVKIEGDGWRLAASEFCEFCNRLPHLRDLAAQYLHGVLDAALCSIGCNAVHSLEARYASWLELLAHRTGRTNIGLKQSEMARLLGAHRSRVTGTASDLQRAGIIRYARGRIHIVDHDRLSKIACACRQHCAQADQTNDANALCCSVEPALG
jgi:CRP-like cAMP-binding protein